MLVAAIAQRSMQIENDLAELLIVLAPAGLAYSWYFYFAKLREEPIGWRNSLTLISLALISLALLLWPAVMMLAPKVNSATFAGAPEYLHFVYVGARAGLGISLMTFVAGLFGRPRPIGPIAVACVGTVLWWLVSTMP
jgi:hypothetical protein